MIRKIDHIAIAVRSLESTVKLFAGILAIREWAVEDIPEQKVRAALLPIGESRIELIEPAGEGSPIAGFLAKRGEGLHHIGIQVEDLAAEVDRLQAAGMRLIDTVPRVGAGGCRIAFLHPSGTAGVLIELSQPGDPETTKLLSE